MRYALTLLTQLRYLRFILGVFVYVIHFQHYVGYVVALPACSRYSATFNVSQRLDLVPYQVPVSQIAHLGWATGGPLAPVAATAGPPMAHPPHRWRAIWVIVNSE